MPRIQPKSRIRELQKRTRECLGACGRQVETFLCGHDLCIRMAEGDLRDAIRAIQGRERYKGAWKLPIELLVGAQAIGRLGHA